MVEGVRDPAAYEWIKRHMGVLSTVTLLATTVVGVVLGVIGAIAGNGVLAENAWAAAVTAAIVGGLVRFGYHIGRRARPDRTEERLAELMDGVTEIQRAVARGKPRVVHQLRQDTER